MYKDEQGHTYNGGTMTRMLDNGSLFSGVPTVEQLVEWGYELQPEPAPYVPTEQDIARQRMSEIQGLLADTDYIVLKKAEGIDISSYDAEYDGDFLAWRQGLRNEYNQLEESLNQL
ncbi:MAG: hypothetical protein J5510_08310 [Prevotella sp.]|nr:hypothetical protein [Prevotella sp.]